MYGKFSATLRLRLPIHKSRGTHSQQTLTERDTHTHAYKYVLIFSYPVSYIYFIKNLMRYTQYIGTACVHTCMHSTTPNVRMYVCSQQMKPSK